MQNCEFAYTGDFICWKMHKSHTIKYINIADARSISSQMLGLGFGENVQTIKPNTLDIKAYVRKGQEKMVTIDPCDVA